MPFKIIKTKDNKFRLLNIKKGIYANVFFKSFESAKNAGMNYMRYRGENPMMDGNMIIIKK